VNIDQPTFPIGQAGNGTIFYQSDVNTTEYFTFGNVLNPITLHIIYQINSVNYDANVCLNYNERFLPISGAELESSCPAGCFGLVSNTSASDLIGASKDLSYQFIRQTNEDTSGTSSYSTQTTVANAYVKPSQNSGAFIVTLPDSQVLQTFQVFWEGKQCANSTEYPIGSNNACVSIPEMGGTVNPSIDAGSWKYYQYVVPDNVEYIQIGMNGVESDMEMYVQNGYYPLREWYLNTDNSVDDDTMVATIVSPSANETYFIGFYNNGDATFSLNANISEHSCNSGSFGYDCSHDSNNTTPLSGIIPLSATLSATNNGTAASYDYEDDDGTYDHNYAYFEITDYPDYPTPYFVRVSVGTNDPSTKSSAPGLFAKQGSIPSAQSNHYNVSTEGDAAHQILIPITEVPPAARWYVAVQLPSDFAIWIGANCAGNCSDGKHGDCYCGNQTCQELTNNGTNMQPVYTRPNSIEDSAGACTCVDDDYDLSYDCTQRSNGNSALYIALIAVGGAIVLLVAIGVPLYCYFANKKSQYDRIM